MVRCFLLSALLFTVSSFFHEAFSLGINYGQVGNNLPPPQTVIEMLKSLNISKARIYDTNPQILSAFSNSGIELIVTVENQMLTPLMDPQTSLQWVLTHIKPYFPSTKITGIAVGNEVISTETDPVLVRNLVPAMVSIYGALVQLGLDSLIHVSTPTSLSVLEKSYPPSSGCFKGEISGIVSELLQFLSATKAPFWINAYPYFAYKDNPEKIPLDYVLFKSPNSAMVDPYTQLQYDNMLYAQVDSVIFAIAGMGYAGIEVGVAETGWPSKGDPTEKGATLENAAIYNRNLLRRQMENEGTPLKPGLKLQVYLFALFNEDLKPGPTSERNYGLYQPDGTMAYNLGLSTLLSAPPPSSSSSSSPSSSSSSFSYSASISLTSSATKAANLERQSLVYWLFVYLLSFHVVTRRTF